jgi:hypothetical protein
MHSVVWTDTRRFRIMLEDDVMSARPDKSVARFQAVKSAGPRAGHHPA